MSTKIIVPPLGESVSEATVKWLKKQGDFVKVDEPVVGLETEKVTFDINSPIDGVLDKILKADEDIVTVDEILGEIVAAEFMPQSQSILASSVLQNKADLLKAISATKELVAESPSSENIDKALMLSPSVRKIISENNLDPIDINSSGKQGRITKEDVLVHLNNQFKEASSTVVNNFPSSAPALLQPTHLDSKPVEKVKMSVIRKTIAQRLKASQNTAAILTTFNEIDMTNVISLRSKYREEFEKKHGIKLGFMSFFVKSTVEALKAIPSINASIEDDYILYKSFYDIGVAVGTDKGLVVPIVKNSDKLSFSDIELEISNLSKKAREGKLSIADLSGGTFSISNGGVYGSLLSTPIINPPQSGILGLHQTKERAVVVNGKIEIRQMMYIALSYDHRLVDGKEAVTFLVKIKESVENPERLLLNI
ncbi:MAG: 2-oxoglutarate dehydrogenase complex dihydrolipoyllysine-residue succinyltransferase [Rickettsiaceae bacterium]|nr:MAG: 2-oxoglutarate dehydrogenase complex dihydrolipoyllysine-residue succinyltransferase [Rickettsiaceae bacterium]